MAGVVAAELEAEAHDPAADGVDGDGDGVAHARAAKAQGAPVGGLALVGDGAAGDTLPGRGGIELRRQVGERAGLGEGHWGRLTRTTLCQYHRHQNLE